MSEDERKEWETWKKALAERILHLEEEVIKLGGRSYHRAQRDEHIGCRCDE